MNYFKPTLLLAFIGLLILIAIGSCATPMGPTGGVPDRTGPKVLSTEPMQGATNFAGRRVEFTFDKYIDRNSFRRNVTIEPDLGITYTVDFRRRTAIVE